MIKDVSAITMKEFAEKLLAGGGRCPLSADYMEYGLQCGWLEAQDVVNSQQEVQRKHAARILHNFLRLEVKEPDEIDAAPAYVLQDLFDCRVCAGHIIQVYVKGIMDGIPLSDGRMIFDADKVVSTEEAEEIVARIFQRKARRLREEEFSQNKKTREPEEISLKQAIKVLQENKRVLLVDVRTEREYAEEHIKGALNAPLFSLMKNPFMFSENRDKIILLYCKEGQQSKAAARCLLDAGYKKVFFFAWKLVLNDL